MRVAVLGTGIMGASMARNVQAAGHEVIVWFARAASLGHGSEDMAATWYASRNQA
jgi:3-hydroxyisobutyrate dehydrogenase-like beta-hydroxyacid dehydrogenase